MKLTSLRIRNYRSIVDSGEIRIEPLQAFVGENNVGKSNLLYALQVFLTAGAGGVGESDFFALDQPIVVTATFGELTGPERKQLRRYLLGDRLILEKQIRLQEDERTARVRPAAEYHGYVAKPKEWWLSADGVIDHEDTTKPDWEKIAAEHGILDYVRDDSGKVNKTSYQAGLRQILIEKEDIEFEEPELGETQALGLQPVLLDWLPTFHLLPAITDYSDEIDRRSSSTNFRRFVGDLADRILKFDPRFQELETMLSGLTALLNAPREGEERQEGQDRLGILEAVEEKLREIMTRVMPSVQGVRLQVAIEGTADMFSRGVSMWIDDGKLTEVLMKGHGLQRCAVFGLMQALILNQRGQLIPSPEGEALVSDRDGRAIIMAIEEPELYIHPQMQRLVYGVLRDFAAMHQQQVLYTTHAPAFIDVGEYEAVAVVRKDCVESGTCVAQCEAGVLDQAEERKTFQFLSSFGLEQNQMFFAKRVILVEGDHDLIAVLATGRQVPLFKEFPEELGCTVIPTDCKQEMMKYMKLLNAFGVPYALLHELDGQPDSDENRQIADLAEGNKVVQLATRLEDVVDHAGHFAKRYDANKRYDAKKFFEDPTHITAQIKQAVTQLPLKVPLPCVHGNPLPTPLVNVLSYPWRD
jgi:putative ATP-dependent endonuclease of OLD family